MEERGDLYSNGGENMNRMSLIGLIKDEKKIINLDPFFFFFIRDKLSLNQKLNYNREQIAAPLQWSK